MSLDPYYATIIIGIVQLMGCSSGIILMKTVCRRGLLLVSTAFCCLTMASLAICIHMEWNWGSLVSLILFTFSHTTGLSPIPWILLGELPTGNLDRFSHFLYFFPKCRVLLKLSFLTLLNEVLKLGILF